MEMIKNFGVLLAGCGLAFGASVVGTIATFAVLEFAKRTLGG